MERGTVALALTRHHGKTGSDKKLKNLKKPKIKVMPVITGQKEFFKGVGPIKYEGPGSKYPLAYRWYDAD